MGEKLPLQRGTTQTADQGPQADAQWQRKWDRDDSRDVGLEAATISKVRNSLPVEPSRPKMTGTKRRTAVADSPQMVGERRRSRRSRTGKEPWSATSAYAGTSNDKTGGKPVRRKHKVSWGRSIRPGSVGT